MSLRATVSDKLYAYDGHLFPNYLKEGNATQYIAPVALKFCQGTGFDVGAGKWPLPGSIPIELTDGGDAMNLPMRTVDYIYSSHALEHLVDPVSALLHWKTRLRHGGCLFLYLPHPDMGYWRPTRNRKHLHIWTPDEAVCMLDDLGYDDLIWSQRDMAWSFTVVGFNLHHAQPVGPNWELE